MIEDGSLHIDEFTATHDAYLTTLLMLFQEVLALWPRPAPGGILLPGYADVIVWGNN